MKAVSKKKEIVIIKKIASLSNRIPITFQMLDLGLDQLEQDLMYYAGIWFG